MNACVYWIRLPEHTDLETQGYVGVTKTFDHRMVLHKSKSETGKTHLHNAIRCYGWDNLVKEIILVGDYAYCFDVERKLRPEQNIGWNGKIGGEGGWDFVNSHCNGGSITIQRIKEKGKFDEYRENVSAGLKRHWANPDLRIKRSNVLKKMWADPQYKKKVLSKRKETMNSLSIEERKKKYGDKQRGVSKPNSPEASEYKASLMKAKWNDENKRLELCENPLKVNDKLLYAHIVV